MFWVCLQDRKSEWGLVGSYYSLLQELLTDKIILIIPGNTLHNHMFSLSSDSCTAYCTFQLALPSI